MKLESEIDDMVKRRVSAGGSSGRVNIPTTWMGKWVLVCLLDEEGQKKADEIEKNRAEITEAA